MLLSRQRKNLHQVQTITQDILEAWSKNQQKIRPLSKIIGFKFYKLRSKLSIVQKKKNVLEKRRWPRE